MQVFLLLKIILLCQKKWSYIVYPNNTEVTDGYVISKPDKLVWG